MAFLNAIEDEDGPKVNPMKANREQEISEDEVEEEKMRASG